MFKFILIVFLLFIAYRLLFGLVIPMYNTTKHFKNKVDEMKKAMNEQQQDFTRQQQAVKEEKKGDYIEYEEIK